MKFKSGQSGNPAGKKPGTLNKKTLVCLALEAAAEDVTKAVIEAAMGGDMQAARLVLERVKPPLRPQSERVRFTLDPSGPLFVQAQQVLSAVATGEVDADTGKMLIDCLSAFGGLRQVDDLAERIAALELAAKSDAAIETLGGVMLQG